MTPRSPVADSIIASDINELVTAVAGANPYDDGVRRIKVQKENRHRQRSCHRRPTTFDFPKNTIVTSYGSTFLHPVKLEVGLETRAGVVLAATSIQRPVGPQARLL